MNDTNPDLNIAKETPTLNFKETLSEELRNDKSLESINTVEDLAKSYASAQKMLGGRIPIPTKDAAPEIKAEFYSRLRTIPGVLTLPEEGSENFDKDMGEVYSKLGRPMQADQYKINIPDELKHDGTNDYIDEVQKVAFAAGLSQRQVDFYTAYQVEKAKEILQSVNDEKVSNTEFLKKEWGNAYNDNLNSFKDLLEKYRSKFPDKVEALERSGAGINPIVLLMAAELNSTYREEGTLNPNSNIRGSMTPELALQHISDIRGNKNHAYYNDKDPEHEAAVARVNRLYQDAYPDLDK